MKPAVLALCLLAVSPVAFAADQPSLSGKWQVHLVIVGRENDQTCTFTQKNSELSGSCESENMEKAEITGTIAEKKVNWTFKSDYNGAPITLNYEGTLEADKISGKVSVPEFKVEGEFTATQAK